MYKSRPLFWVFANFIFAGSAAAQTTLSIWDHNGSTVYLSSDGASRKFFYQNPRPTMREAGVHAGTLLFEGHRERNQYSGTAYVFSRACGAIGYPVSGTIADDQRSVTMYGRAPIRDSNCNVIKYHPSVLHFAYEGAANAAEISTGAAVSDDHTVCFSQGTPTAATIDACGRLISSGQLSREDLYATYLQRGNAWYATRQYDQAISDFSNAMQLNPNPRDPSSQMNIGLALQLKGDCQEALPYFSSAIELNRGLVFAYTHRGQCYEAIGQTDRAVADYNAAIALPAEGQGVGPTPTLAQENARQRLAAMTSATTAQPDREPVTKSPEADAKPDAPVTPIPNSAVSKAVAAITPTISKMIVIAAAFTFVILLSAYAWRSSFPNGRTEVQMQYRALRFISLLSKIVGWVMIVGAGSYFVYALVNVLSLLPDTQRGQPWLALPLLSMSAVIATAFAGLLLVAFGEIISALIDMATNSYELKSVARDIRQMLNVTENMATSLRPVQRDDAQ